MKESTAFLRILSEANDCGNLFGLTMVIYLDSSLRSARSE
jgi:hypothetical protein